MSRGNLARSTIFGQLPRHLGYRHLHSIALVPGDLEFNLSLLKVVSKRLELRPRVWALIDLGQLGLRPSKLFLGDPQAPDEVMQNPVAPHGPRVRLQRQKKGLKNRPMLIRE